jgi:hypothetical protein
MPTRRRLNNSNLPWAGWKYAKPVTQKDRLSMKQKCGSSCFLSLENSFPICTKKTCKINAKGIWAAYLRAREWGSKNKRVKAKNTPQKTFRQIANKARTMLRKRGYDVGKTLRATRQRRRRQRHEQNSF